MSLEVFLNALLSSVLDLTTLVTVIVSAMTRRLYVALIAAGVVAIGAHVISVLQTITVPDNVTVIEAHFVAHLLGQLAVALVTYGIARSLRTSRPA